MSKGHAFTMLGSFGSRIARRGVSSRVPQEVFWFQPRKTLGSLRTLSHRQTRAFATAMNGPGDIPSDALLEAPHVAWQRDMNLLVMRGLQEGDPSYFINALSRIKHLYSGPVKTRLRSRVFCAQSYLLHVSGMIDEARENLEVVHDEATVPEPLKLYNIDMMGMLNDYAVMQLMSGRLDAATTALVKAIYWCHMELRVNEDFRRHFDQVQNEARMLHQHSPLLSIYGMFLDEKGPSGMELPEGMAQPPMGDPNMYKFHFLVRMKGPPKESDPHSKEWVKMDSLMNKMRDPEYLNSFYATALNHMAEVEVRRKHYSDALDLLEDAWTVFCEDHNTDPSAVHISAAIRTNLGACWRKYSRVEDVPNELGERFAETAVAVLDTVDPRLQFGMLHSAASVSLAIYRLQRPTLRRRREARSLAANSLEWVQQLDEARDGPHCIPPLLIAAAAAEGRTEALALYERAQAIAAKHADHLGEGGLKEVVDGILEHNMGVLSGENLEKSSGGLWGSQLENYSMVEWVPLEKHSESKLYVLGQSALVLGIHIDGGLWNLDEEDKRSRIEQSRWIYPSEPGGGYLPQRDAMPSLEDLLNANIGDLRGEGEEYPEFYSKKEDTKETNASGDQTVKPKHRADSVTASSTNRRGGSAKGSNTSAEEEEDDGDSGDGSK